MQNVLRLLAPEKIKELTGAEFYAGHNWFTGRDINIADNYVKR
jgi:glycogen debranching enzyme